MSLFDALFDDAAVFPPGQLALADAVPAHLAHRVAPYEALVGPLVLGAKDLGSLGAVLPERSVRLDVAVVGPLDALAAVAAVPGVRCVALEVALPDALAPDELVASLERALASSPPVTTYVEVPRDERRAGVLDALAGTAYLAKFRTGGVRADLHPDDAELAGALLGAVRAGVAFKATAGLHHAIRNTDAATGFEQHGFLNVLAATGAALDGADEGDLVQLLAERDPARVTALVRALDPRTREHFRSFGTCSVTEPLDDLVGLGLLEPVLEVGS